MSTEECVKFNIIRPKREARPLPKKRLTFDGKEFTRPQRQQQQCYQQRQRDSKGNPKEEKKIKSKSEQQQTLPPLDDDSDNQGFADWLRSADGVDMMRLFVIANSILVLVTMAWPHMQETFAIVRELIYGEEEE